MAEKLMVSTRTTQDAAAVRDSGAEVLAEYPNGLLVRANAEQAAALAARGLSSFEIETPVVQTASAQFAFADAAAADEAAPVPVDAHRTAYYLVQLVGPTKDEWLATIRGRGGIVHGSLPGYRLIVGMLPSIVDAVRTEPFVDAITAYRPAMKLSPHLRPDVAGRGLDTPALREITAAGVDDRPDPVQVQVTVFDGESSEDVAAAVRAAGGTVLSVDPHTVLAWVPPAGLLELAERQGVEAILPHAFPTTTNDRAADVMNVPADHVFGGLTLTGAGQMVGVVDSGLDTGDPATVTADLAGRVTIVSSPNQFGALSIDQPPFDDGAADEHAHGTHVSGSVAGSGANAVAAGSTTVPRGIAPAAALHFTAVGQRVNWGPGVPPTTAAYGLYGLPNDVSPLFQAAYTAGARIHTNSWGSRNTQANPNVEGSYDAQSRAVDQYMAVHRDALVLFSAGNNGRDTDANVQIDADSIGTPGTAKNCLTVGASENDRPSGSTPTTGNNFNWAAPNFFGSQFAAFAVAGHVSDNPAGMALFSSRGPCDDGRLKPEVVAPGTNVLSIRSSAHNSTYIGRPPTAPPLWGEVTPATDPLAGDYCWSGGTSMATPLVAGAAALVRQHLVAQRGHQSDGVTPSGALVKAFLVNGAVPMAGQYPGEVPAGANSVDGFGRVDVTASLAPGLLGQTLFSDDPTLAVGSMTTRTFTVTAVDPGQPMKITLVWTDPPSPVGVGGLQNQLYLQVQPPGGAPVLEGDLTAFPTATNPTQQVVVAAPVAGDYLVHVHGISVSIRSAGAGAPPGTVQDFALVASNVMGLSANTVSIAETIDTTGSMDFYGFIEPAKERAAQLVDFVRSGDRVAVSEFSHRAAPPDGRTPFPVRTMTSVSPDWTDARAAIASLIADGTTPIGSGLQAAWAQLSGEPASRPRAIVLLSDGFNNTAPDPATVLPTIPADVPIFTIALGPAALTSALQAIAVSRPGGGYFAIHTDQDVHALHEIYAIVQALASGMSILSLSSVAVAAEGAADGHVLAEVAVEAGLSEIAFCASWDDDGKGLEIELVDPSGIHRDASTFGTMVFAAPTDRIVRVAVPEPGTWRVLARSTAASRRVTVSAAARSDLRLVLQVRRLRSRLAVLGRLLQGTRPVDEAEVAVRLTLPTLSVRDALLQHADRLEQVTLPKELDEPGLTARQGDLVRLGVLGLEVRGQNGGLFGWTTIEATLEPQGGGRYATMVELPAVGTVRVDGAAHGKTADGHRWQRHAQTTATVAERRAP